MYYKKDRIIFLLHLPPPVHGASKVGEYIKNSKILKDKFDCKFINLSTSSSLSEIGAFNIKKIFKIFKIYLNLFNFILNRPSLCYITLNTKGLAFYKDFAIIFFVKLITKKVVYHFHNIGLKNFANKNFINKILVRFALHNAHVILLSNYVKEDVCDLVAENNIYYLPNGIVNNNYELPKIQNKSPIILFLSNLIKEKGVYELLNACVLLKKDLVPFKCWFVGDYLDVEEKTLFDYIHKNDLTNYIECFGPRYGEQKIAKYNEADIFVLPTYYKNEIFPLAILEAMKYSLPIVATNIGAIPEIVDDEKNGFIIMPNNVDELTNKLELLLKDSNLREKMGKYGRDKFLKNYTLETFENKFIEILDDIIKK